jgi:hypothetical protein
MIKALMSANNVCYMLAVRLTFFTTDVFFSLVPIRQRKILCSWRGQHVASQPWGYVLQVSELRLTVRPWGQWCVSSASSCPMVHMHTMILEPEWNYDLHWEKMVYGYCIKHGLLSQKWNLAGQWIAWRVLWISISSPPHVNWYQTATFSVGSALPKTCICTPIKEDSFFNILQVVSKLKL